ncbi:MAG: hypothetical protein ACJ71F_00380 [Nitrososphaeraceae archaeon]
MMIIMTMMTSISLYGYKKALAILVAIVSVSILTIIGVANAVYNTSTTTNPNLQYQGSYNQCDHAHALHVKMFDSETVPKYIIGKDYKIIPVSPTTTDGLVNGCTLAAEAISQ